MKLLISTLTALLFLNTSTEPINPFDITIYKKGNQVQMKCASGCDWEKIKFDITKTKYINSSGVYTYQPADQKGQKFSFRVSNFQSGLSFESLLGTTWKKLKFSNPNSRFMYLDERGIGSEKD